MTEIRPPSLLPGLTAHDWWWRGERYGFASVALFLVALLVPSLVPDPLRDIGRVGLFVTVAIFVALSGWATYRGYEAVQREKAAGYTTLDYLKYGLYGRPRRRLWHLDPKTGRVLRWPVPDRDPK